MQRILSLASEIRNTSNLLTALSKVALIMGLSVGAHNTYAVERIQAVDPVHEFTLDNGLKILVKQDKRAPVVVSQLWYKVGSSYEHGGITGVSHVVEHMMFKGTTKYPTGEFNRIIGENGAEDNAFTSLDYTAYYQVLASDRLEVAMELESDRVRGLTLPPEEFKKEIKVVQEERRWRTEDSPNALTYEQFMATAFMNSPYHNPVIGWMTDLENLKVEDLRAWYERWYAPNNAVLVVVGDVEPDKVFELAKKYYAPLKPSDLPTIKPQTEAPQKGLRTIQVKAPAEVPYIMLGYKTPALVTAKPEDTWEPYALEVLASILDGGSSSRLTRELVRGKELVSSAGAWYSGDGRLPNLLVLAGTPAKDIKIDTVKTELLAQVERLRKELVSTDELARVKAQVIAGEIYQRDSIQHQATVLGSLETVGLGYKMMDEYVDKVLAITPGQIQTVAQKYLVEDQLTVAELVPQPIDQSKPRFAPTFVR
jgi:zinc protease